MNNYPICPRCHRTAELDAIFCSRCAARLYSPQTSQRQQSSRSQHLALKIGGAIFGALFLLAIVSSIAGSLSRTSTTASLKSTPPVTNELQLQAASYVAPSTFSINGKVVGVSDGDTIVVLDDKKTEYKIRLAGIDAPEAGQDFGSKAKENLSAQIYGCTVSVTGNKIDNYGRLVGKVILDGRDINLEQIRNGFAWHYKKHEAEQTEADRSAYAGAETSARSLELNLWSLPNPIAPWDFRNAGNIDPALKGKIFANSNSMKYHWEGCPGYAKISIKNRIVFDTWEEAEAAGYAAVTNCSKPRPESTADLETGTESDDEGLTVYAVPQLRTAATPQAYEYVAPAPASTPFRYEQYSARPTPLPARVPDFPVYESTVPAVTSVATAICADGTFSYSQNRSGTCSHHGGVARWLDSSTDTSSTYSTPSYPSSSSTDAYDPRPKTVQVRGYFRKDGTYVRPHTRRAPRR